MNDAALPEYSTSNSTPDRLQNNNNSDTASGPQQNIDSLGEALVPLSMKKSDYPQCNACQFCADTCFDPSCPLCVKKRKYATLDQQEKFEGTTSLLLGFLKDSIGFPKGNDLTQLYTPCQLRRHNSIDSVWLKCGNDIYDATLYVQSGDHPGGQRSILRKAGGVKDCTVDMSFHSTKAVRVWKKNYVGKLRPCPGESTLGNIA